MKNLFKNTKIKNFAAISALIPLIVFSASMTITAGLNPDGVRLYENVFADDASGAESVLSLQKTQEALDYLKKIDTNQGRLDFQNYLNDKIRQKDRLAEVRANLAYQIAQSYNLNAASSSIVIPDFTNPNPEHEAAPENLTFRDLISRMESEANGGQMILKELKSFNDVINLLKSNSAINEIARLEKKSGYENELIGFLEIKGESAFGPLLSELYLDSAITEFFITYATTGQLLIDRLQTYNAGIDTATLNAKLDKELSVLSLLNGLYPTEAEKAAPLDEYSATLAKLYFGEHIDEAIAKYTNSLAQSDEIISYLNDDKLQISDDLFSKIKYLESVLIYARADKTDVDSFKNSASQLYDFMAEANQGNLDSSPLYSGIFGILKDFDFLLAYNTVSAFDEIDAINEEYPSVIDYEIFLKRKAEEKAKEESEAAVSAPAETPQPSEPATTTPEIQPAEITNPPATETPQPSEPATTTPEIQTSDTQVAPQPSEPSATVAPENQPAETQANPTQTVVPDVSIPVGADDTKPAAPEQQSAVSDSATTGGQESGSGIPAADAPEQTTNIAAPAPVAAEPVQAPASGITDVNPEMPANQEPAVSVPATADGQEPAVSAEDVSSGTATVNPPEQTNDIVVTEPPAEEPGKESFDVTLQPVIEETDKVQVQTPQPTEEAVQENASEIISLLQGQDNVSQEDEMISRLISENPDIISVDKAIADLDRIVKYGLLTADIINGIAAGEITLPDFTAFLDKLNVTSDDLDELLNFLNQLISELGYAPKVGEFSGINGVIRFGADKCPDIAAWQSIQPSDEIQDFPRLSADKQGALRLSENEKQKDPEYSRLKLLRGLNLDFCVQQSTDITTRNLVGLPEYTKLPTDEYKIDQGGINIDFSNNATRDIKISLGNTSDTITDSRTFTVKHTDASTVAAAPVITDEIQTAVGDAVQAAVDEKMGKNVVVEKIETVPETSAETPAMPLYTMSALENPNQMFTPAQTEHKEDLKNAVIYESADHRKNIAEIFTDEAHAITHRHINDYTIYNYGTGSESDTTVYENAVLRKNAYGDIEGYIIPVVAPIVAPVVDPVVAPIVAPVVAPIVAPVVAPIVDSPPRRMDPVIEEIYKNGLPAGPDFIIKAQFVLNKDSQVIDGFKYEITGDKHDSISYTINTKADIYPMVLKSGITFVSQGQTYFDRYTDSPDKSSGRFGSSSVMGDFNGDGYSDLAASSYAADGNSGKVSIYFSKKDASGQSTYRMDKPDVIIKGGDLNYFGDVLAAGDIDGDGASDLVIGSPDYNKKQGIVWYFRGATLTNGLTESRISDTAELSSDSADAIIEGAGESDGFGSSILLQDLNKDGKTDLAVSAPLDRNGTGVVHLFYNETILQNSKFQNLNSKSETLNSNFDATAIQQNVNNVTEPLKATDADINIAGEGGNIIDFGRAMASADFDDDGNNDFAISAGGLSGGRVYLFLQNETPWTNQETSCQKNCAANNADIIISGQNNFGAAMSAGDFNADKKEDLAVGAPGLVSEDISGEGNVYIFYQDENPWTNQDTACVNCDAENADVKITGQKGESFGAELISADFNNDGRADLAAGASSSGFNRGGVYVFYSNPSSASDDAQAQAEKPNIANKGMMNASDESDILWTGELLSSFGYSLSYGDINADRIMDISVGAPRLHNFAGGAYVFYGRQGTPKENMHPANETKPEELTEEEKAKQALETEPQNPQNVTGFTINPDDINQAVTDVQKDNQGYLADISVPDKPVITCDGFTDGVTSSRNYASCSWTDTAGPSKGVYKYCTDNTNTCAPDAEDTDRYVDIINLASHHNYLRVQTSDDGGQSEIASFDIAIDNLPSIVSGPSDGGSDELNPVKEGSLVGFSATAQDPEKDPYYMLICRTSGAPVYIDGKLQCQGVSDNSLCESDLTDSGKEAECPFKIQEEPGKTLLWYAFVCEAQDLGGGCSQASQGTGATGSPLYINHIAKHGQVNITDTLGGTIEPGDRLLFTLPQKNITFVPEDSKVTMYVCSSETTGFDYQENKCIGGDMICSSEPVNPASVDAVCAEPVTDKQVVPVPTHAGENHVNVFVKYGVKGLVEGISEQKYDVEDVSPTVVSYANDGDISIAGGGSAKVNFSAVIDDLNGSSDIQKAEGVFFDSDQVWNNCDPSRNDCYVDDGCDLTTADETSVKADCTVEVFYNANASALWKTHVNTINASGKFTELGDSPDSRTVPPLSAINQEEITVPYDLVLPGQIAGPVETVLTNLGNQPSDVLISGTDLVGKENTLPRELQKWSVKKDFDYDTEGYSLVETPSTGDNASKGCANLTLPVRDDSKEENVSIYWKIRVPENQKADVYSGSVFFNPAPDTCVD